MNVDPYLVAAVTSVESKFKPSAVGKAGEIGLMQIKPQFYSGNPRNLFKAEENIRFGTKYLKHLQENCKHKKDHTFLVCYNAGPTGGARIAKPKEFDYYKKVHKKYKEFKKQGIFSDYILASKTKTLNNFLASLKKSTTEVAIRKSVERIPSSIAKNP